MMRSKLCHFIALGLFGGPRITVSPSRLWFFKLLIPEPIANLGKVVNRSVSYNEYTVHVIFFVSTTV